jgi:hypothetical protein
LADSGKGWGNIVDVRYLSLDDRSNNGLEIEAADDIQADMD